MWLINWMPFWLIRIFSEYGLWIVLGIGAPFAWVIKDRVRGKIDEWPEWLTGPLIVYVVLAGFFFYTYANSGFHIEDTLFSQYYYVGRVKNGKAIGKGRQYDSVDYRLVYSGDFEDNCRSGQGTYYYENGDRYKGQWANDQRNGVGIYYPKGGKPYRGEWVNDEFITPSAPESDSATPVLPDELIEVNHTYKNGDRYTGQWAHDMPQGQGTMYYANDERYEGAWLDGKRMGQGTLYYASDNSFNRKTYTGQWADDKMNGYGVLEWANGDRYEGDFVDDKRHGQGTYYCANGDRYEGDSVDGKFQGQGTFYFADDGGHWTGPAVDDKLQGWGVYYYADGTSKEVEARDHTVYR